MLTKLSFWAFANPRWIRGCLLMMPTLGAMVWFHHRQRHAVLPEVNRPLIERSRSVSIGGVQRPASDHISGGAESDFAKALRVNAQVGERTVMSPPPESLQQFTLLDAETNIHARGVIEAAESGQNPERLTPTILPAPFNPARYAADPESYLSVVEPGRIWQSAQPGPSVKRIRSAGRRMQRLKPYESVRLAVRVDPGAPVTFTSFDLGVFDNKLPSVTVQADDKGVATVAFTAVQGTVNDVNIVAASPVTSGQVQFLLTVIP